MYAELQINSGIDRSRIVEWLEQELGAQERGQGVYQLTGCTVILEQLPANAGILYLPRTLVSFCGEDQRCRIYQQQFRLRFLSAGG